LVAMDRLGRLARTGGLILAVLGGAALPACGSEVSQDAGRGSARGQEPSPPIRSVDRSVSRHLMSVFGSEISGGSGSEYCFSLQSDKGTVKGQEEECDVSEGDDEAGLPADQPNARLLAELLIAWPGPEDRAVVISYESRGKGSCFNVQVLNLRGDGALPLNCDGGERSGPISLVATSKGDIASPAHTVLGGLVSSDADSIRITFARAAAATYSLTGPLARGFSRRRIFVVDLGRRSRYRRIELLREGTVLAVERPTRLR
jgi:hypothetical protein